MTVFRFALRRAFRSPLNLLLLCVLPVGAAFLPEVPGWAVPMGFQMYGGILLFGAFMMLRSVVEEATRGTDERVAVAPIARFRYLAETLLAYALILVAQSAAMVCLGLLGHGRAIPSPLLLFAAYSAFSIASLALSLAGCALFRDREAAYQGFSLVLLAIAMIGGLFWPIEIMPPPLRRAAMVTPCYWLVDAMGAIRGGAAGGGAEAGRFVLDLAIMLLFSVAFLLVGSRRRMT